MRASIENLRRAAGSAAIKGFFEGTSRLVSALPIADLARHGVEVEKDVPYSFEDHPEHRLDIYRPVDRKGPLPVVFYVHGGGFKILSKETHWIFGLTFAKQGYLVVSIDYRLAPRHPFPAGLMDTFLAWRWLLRECERLGGDPERIVVAGESAGANLVTSLTLAACAPRPEPWAQAVFDAGRVPAAALPACGLFQVSDPGRYVRAGGVSNLVGDRLATIAADYLGSSEEQEERSPLWQLADPLLWLESGVDLKRPLPPFFLPVGTRDALEDDTRRLDVALSRHGAVSEPVYYEGGVHAFHAFVFTEVAKRCWEDTWRFLDRHLDSAKLRAHG